MQSGNDNSKGTETSLDLIHAYFFFVDIVGLSDPAISVKRQKSKIEALNSLISSCEVFQNKRTTDLVLPTGDGVAIGFQQGPQFPLMLAMQLHEKLRAYNKGKSPDEALFIRIGLNDGPVYVVKDLQTKDNVWGPGIILARRVMDIGDAEHILVSEHTAETLRSLSDDYKKLINPLPEVIIKHGERMKVYSVYNARGIGNHKMPKTIQESKITEVTDIRKLNMIDNAIDIELTIKDPKNMLTHHKRTHKVECIADEPIRTLKHGIATDVPKSFADLNVRVTDESGRELKIIRINYDTDYQKEFVTFFERPIIKGEKGRAYSVEYDVEEPERYFENYFTLSCKKFTMSLMYPSDGGFQPVLYDVDIEKGTEARCKIKPKVQQLDGNLVKVTWTKKNLLETQAFRVRW